MILLRDVVESDLSIFFEHQRDELSIQMARFPAREKEAFYSHWAKILSNEKGLIQTILFDGQVAGNILFFEMEGEKEVGYWLGREFWGKGIATEALKQFLKVITVRPLSAHTAKQNIGSRKVLEKCGFVVVGEDKWTPPTSTQEVEEFVLRLE